MNSDNILYILYLSLTVVFSPYYGDKFGVFFVEIG